MMQVERLNTLNALPKGLPPRHLRGNQNRNPNYTIPQWGLSGARQIQRNHP